MKFRKNSKGITLVALVVTIIVLLILAGVSISLVSGGNGILDKATKAVDETNEGSMKEETELLFAEIQANYYEAKYVNGTEVGKYGDYVETVIKNKQTASGAKVEITDGKVYYKEENAKTEAEIGTFDKESGKLTINGTVKEGAITPPEEQKVTITFTMEGANGDIVTITNEDGSYNETVEFGEGNTTYTHTMTNVPKGDYTFTSAIAKDTETGENDYYKVVTLDEHTTEVKVMPEGAIYWCGNLLNNTFEAYPYERDNDGDKPILDLNRDSKTLFGGYESIPSYAQYIYYRGSVYLEQKINFSKYNNVKAFFKNAYSISNKQRYGIDAQLHVVTEKQHNWVTNNELLASQIIVYSGPDNGIVELQNFIIDLDVSSIFESAYIAFGTARANSASALGYCNYTLQQLWLE